MLHSSPSGRNRTDPDRSPSPYGHLQVQPLSCSPGEFSAEPDCSGVALFLAKISALSFCPLLSGQLTCSCVDWHLSPLWQERHPFSWPTEAPLCLAWTNTVCPSETDPLAVQSQGPAPPIDSSDPRLLTHGRTSGLQVFWRSGLGGNDPTLALSPVLTKTVHVLDGDLDFEFPSCTEGFSCLSCSSSSLLPLPSFLLLSSQAQKSPCWHRCMGARPSCQVERCPFPPPPGPLPFLSFTLRNPGVGWGLILGGGRNNYMARCPKTL